MKIPAFSVKYKVTTTMLVLILVVVGFISLTRLGLDFFPDLEFPTVSVITTYAGASSEDIEKTITQTLEEVVSSVSGVKKVTSQSQEGVSLITVEFEWGTNLDFGAQDLRDQIGLYRAFLPEAASDPLVVKFNMAMLPVVFYGVTGPMPALELKTLLEDDVAPRLERIDGVAAASAGSFRAITVSRRETTWASSPRRTAAPGWKVWLGRGFMMPARATAAIHDAAQWPRASVTRPA